MLFVLQILVQWEVRISKKGVISVINRYLIICANKCEKNELN